MSSESKVVPKDWTELPIESVLDRIIDYRGKSAPKSDAGIPLITAKNVRKGFIDKEPREFIYEDKYDSWMVRGIPKFGDIFITTEAPLGNVAKVPKYKFAIGQRLLALCPITNIIFTDFLLQVLQGEKFNEQLDLQSTGSTVAGIKQSTFRKIPLHLPPLPEQQKIAAILSSVDEVIEKTQAQIDKLKDLKTGMMQELLTKGIGPGGVPHTEFKDTPVGRIPVGWEATTIFESCKIKNTLRKPISKEERESMKGVYPYYGPTKAVDYIDEYRVEGDHTLIGEDGDHFTKFATWSMTQFVTGKFNVNNHAHIIEGGDNCRTKWIYYYFIHRNITASLTRQGATRYKLNKATLEKLELATPPIDEQDRIITIFDAMMNDISMKEKRVGKLADTKKALMQDLLTGKVRTTHLLNKESPS
ncbi:MAG: restriction endonuclease subunit S [Pseudomonadales bacterium]|nr:restriction endonuclease subunit S [Pseudomonadales bacterium]